jgi:hypothetical protein
LDRAHRARPGDRGGFDCRDSLAHLPDPPPVPAGWKLCRLGAADRHQPALDHLRRKRPEQSLLTEPAGAPPPDYLLQQETRAKIQQAFRRLPAKLQVAATLALVEERPYAEIADALGTSVGAVKLRVFRAVRILRKQLSYLGVRPWVKWHEGKEMTEHDDHQIRKALRQSFPPVNTELRRDLWPAVLRKLDARPTRVPWYDLVLIGLSASVFLFFPQLILVFAYHL